ncbi:LysR family transcriptional regulator [Clostridium sp. MCC353]|uniref:LysR family transcriptional regulator n=1 Tax=Clostridium sp. MCC353 TaxID=2592646 RepID=UPI001C0094F2|nr:LysR family transcriptional regulator [Clostridium sp. MCC353]
MDIVQLEYFKAVAESGHLTNAAKKLNVAQPALSVSIARLESEVGVPLFDRIGRGIYLNKCGEIYLEHVEQALDILSKAQREVDTYCKKLENVLNLGIVSKPFSQMMLVHFKEQFPNSRIRQINITPDSIEEELQKNEVDYVISSRLSSAPGIVGEMIREEKMMLAVSSSHPLAERKTIRLCDLKGEEFINLPKEYEYRMITDEMCQNSGFTANVTTECFHCHMAEMVAAGEGIALMTEERARKNAGNSQLAFIPIVDPEYTRKHYIVWKAGHHFNGMAKEFRKYVISYFESEGEGDCSGCG